VYDLDPNAPSWQRIIERDADRLFAGPPSITPFGSALYLWGETAIYCLRFGDWTPRSLDAAVDRLRAAQHERTEYLPGGRLAFYIQLPRGLWPKPKREIRDGLADLDLLRASVIVGSIAEDWQTLDILMIAEF